MSGYSGRAVRSSSDRHSFFKAVVVINLLADIFMALYSGIISGKIMLLLGMIVLSIWFIVGIIAVSAGRISMRKTSCTVAGFGYTVANGLIGFIFANQMFGIVDESIGGYAETTAIILVVIIVLTVVGFLTRLKVEDSL